MRKIISFVIFFQLAFMLTFSSHCIGQGLSVADIKTQMIKDWERAKLYTVDYLNTMPADKYSFKAVDSLRSFAQQMLHLASGNVFLMSSATGDKPLSWLMSDPEHRSSSQRKDSVMYYVTASYDYCINQVRNSDTDKWAENTKLFNRFEQCQDK